jgi:hypothetical protein
MRQMRLLPRTNPDGRIGRKARHARGSALVEFALAAPLLVTITVGVFGIGLNLVRSIQVIQIMRDAGHMYARGVDFSTAGAQQTLAKLAQGLNLEARVVLTTVRFITDADCTAAGLTGSDCTNRNQPVMVHRLAPIGDAALGSSYFGEPPSPDSRGYVSPNVYLRDSRARARDFQTVMALNQDELAYVVETFVPTPDVAFRVQRVYARGVF